MSQSSKIKHTEDFKCSAVTLVSSSGKSVSEVAKDLGINQDTLRVWVKKYGKLDAIETSIELKRLKKELKVARQERDILKKALAYFAQETQ